MRKDVRYATPRSRPPREVPVGWISALVCMLLVLGLGLIAYVLARQVNESAKMEPTVRHDSLDVTRTYNGELIRWYVFTDPDSGVQYLVNDRGGVCVRERREVVE